MTSDDRIARKLARLSASGVADALGGGRGVIAPGLRRFSGAGTVVGRAVTADCPEGSLQPVFEALDQAKPGDFLCTKAPGNSAYLGDLLAADIAGRGLVGGVIDGMIRDRAMIKTMAASFFARGLSPAALRRQEPGRSMVPIEIGGVVITPGDWLVADDDGVVVVAPAEVEEVLARAEQNSLIEDRIMARIRAGAKVRDAVREELAKAADAGTHPSQAASGRISAGGPRTIIGDLRNVAYRLRNESKGDQIAMNITGPESLLMGVEDLEESRRFLTLYGLRELEHGAKGATFEALDGSSVDLRLAGDASLPDANVRGPTLRAAVWGVKSAADLDAIAGELSKDRQIRWVDGVLQSTDDDQNALFFRVSQRRPYEAPDFAINVAGVRTARFNQRVNFDEHGLARQMGHVVYWTKDPKKSVEFYRDRLGFRITDLFRDNMGVFARAQGHSDHHSLFLMRHADIPPSFQHAEFTFGDAQEVMAGGYKLTQAGYETAFGPGRFELGSNWFWYLKTPMGGAFELGADMDQIDDNWVPGEFDNPGVTGGWHFDLNKQFSRQR